MLFEKILYSSRVRKIRLVIKVLPRFILNLFFSKKSVFLVTGARTGTSLYIAIRLIERGFNIYLISGSGKVIERFLSKKVFISSLDEDDVERFVNIGKDLHVKAVMYGNSELYLHFVSKLSQALGFVSISEEAAIYSANKHKLSEKLKDFDDRISFNPFSIKDEDELDAKKPCFLKPVDGCGNDEVVLFKSSQDAYKYWKENKKTSKREYIIEQKFIGKQYDIEGIADNGEYHIISITREYYLHADNRQVYTHGFKFEPSMDDELKEKIINYTKDFLSAIGVTNGAFQFEFVIEDDSGCYWIDFGNRVGGTFEFIIERTTGVKWLDLVIDNAMGDKLDFTKKQKEYMLMLYAATADQYEFLRKKLAKKSNFKKLSYQFEPHPYIFSCELSFKNERDLLVFEKEFLRL